MLTMLACSMPSVSVYCQSELKTVWMLTRSQLIRIHNVFNKSWINQGLAGQRLIFLISVLKFKYLALRSDLFMRYRESHVSKQKTL